MAAEADRHDEAVRQFIEQLGMLLADTGLPRMPARVFAYVVADDAEIYTVTELADGLQVSQAAASEAVRVLVHAGLLARERPPGARADHYRVYDDDVWAAITAQQVPVLERYDSVLTDGVELLGINRPGGRRVYETREYFRFLRMELAGVMERWRDHRQALFDGDDRPDGRS